MILAEYQTVFLVMSTSTVASNNDCFAPRDLYLNIGIGAFVMVSFYNRSLCILCILNTQMISEQF